MGGQPAEHYDVVIVGAGTGGIYGVHRLCGQGLSVLCVEAAPEVGGVWYHNAYPGARVDVESANYCYFFDPDLYRDWKWTERYAAQPELLSYLNHVADRYGVRPHIRFNTWMTAAQWDPLQRRYIVTIDPGDQVTGRFLIMATGQLSKPRKPAFAGLEDFRGEWAQTSHWHPVAIEGQRVGVIGTGSSGVQTVTAVAPHARQLHVFQRTAHYCIPARNGPADDYRWHRIAGKVADVWAELLDTPGGATVPPVCGLASDFSPEQQQAILEERWAYGGQAILATFADQATNAETNRIVVDFVRQKSRERIDDPHVGEKLLQYSYPIGVRRICIDTGYYECFNQDNVSLVDIAEDPIEGITETGIRLNSGEQIELDTIIFALGFEAFTGSLDQAGITNEHGQQPSANWARGPRTYLGLTTSGFPNLFLPTGPGSPSVLANMNLANVVHFDFVGDLIAHMATHGYTRVEPTAEAEDKWTAYVASFAERLIRRQHDNYMVHVNRDDGSRVFIPFAGGMARYVERCREVIADDFKGLAFS